MTSPDPRVTHVAALANVLGRSPRPRGAPRHPTVSRRLERAARHPRWPVVTFWILMALGVLAISLLARPAGAQWSVAPVIAVGAGVPADAGDNLNEGVAAKAGLWIRSPAIPFGMTVEGLYSRLGGTRTPEANSGVQVGGVSVNLTTRRHDSRFDTYLVGGAGYYWHSSRDGRLSSSGGPGVNAGIGEVFAVSGHDLFVELRYHRLRVDDSAGDRWMSVIPLVFGVRF